MRDNLYSDYSLTVGFTMQEPATVPLPKSVDNESENRHLCLAQHSMLVDPHSNGAVGGQDGLHGHTRSIALA